MALAKQQLKTELKTEPKTRRRVARLNDIIGAGGIWVLAWAAVSQDRVTNSGFLVAWAVAGLMMLCACRALLEPRPRLVVPAVLGPLGALILLGGLQTGLARTVDAAATRRCVIGLVFLGAFTLILANLSPSRERLRSLARVLVGYGAAMGGLGLVLALDGVVAWWWPEMRDDGAHGFFLNRNHYAGYMELLAPIPVALLAVRGAAGRGKTACWIASGLMGLAIVESLSRGGMLGFGVEMLIVLGASRPWERLARRGEAGWRAPGRGAVAAALVILLGLASLTSKAGPVVHRMRETIQQLRSEDPDADVTDGRKPIWRDTWEMIKANPWTGVGLGAYPAAYPLYQVAPIYCNGRLFTVRQAHNDYLQVLADGGALGGGIALWFLGLVLRLLRRPGRFADPVLRGLTLGAKAAIAGMLVHSFFDFNLQLFSHALLFFFLLIVVTSAASADGEQGAGAAGEGREHERKS